MLFNLSKSIVLLAAAISEVDGSIIGQDVLQANSAFGKGVNKAQSLLQKAGELYNQNIHELDDYTKMVWSEMEMKYPKIVSEIKMTSEPISKISRKPDSYWDFHVENANFQDYQLRVKKSDPESLGVDSVKQYSGYLDIKSEDKHFFYWFFESRNDPKNDPIVLWLNGGPGCSSLTGLFFELGPASIDKGLKVVSNPHSWNNNASVIFLDQPVNVGYSYSSGSVSDTVTAGKDVYAFLELFFQNFPEYNNGQFHIAGESYGGHYIPTFAAEIVSHDDRSFNLTSVLIGNGLTDPLTQYPEYEPMACDEKKSGAPPSLEEEECENMLNTLPRCLSLIESCYDSGSIFSCIPATIYCNNGQIGPFQRTGKNVYDVRKDCDGSDLCYKGLEYIDQYLNQDFVKEKTGAEVDVYKSCNFDVNKNFMYTGDWMKPFHKHVITLLEKEVPVLIYAGDKDFICNWLGNKAWTDNLDWSGKEDFNDAKIKQMYLDNKKQTHVGDVKNFDYFTFARIFGAGHMVPYDQPEASLQMLNSWIAGDYSLGTTDSK